MSEATTLRAVAGLSNEPAALSNAALVMIDCQNTYREGQLQLTGVEEALEECVRLLDRARLAGTTIFHIQHDSGPGSLYDISARIGQIAEPVAPRGDEPVIVKNRPNSFVGTDLHDRLQASGRENLILAGFMTHMCVNSTARGAFNLGYGVTVVADATATRDVALSGGGFVAARDLHEASLAAVGDLFSIVVSKASDLPA